MRPFLVPSLLLLSATLVAAEPVTLGGALREAVQARPSVRAARLEAAAAEAAVGEARGRLLPRLTLEERFVATDEPATSLFIALNQQQLELRQDSDFYNFPSTHRDFETRLTLEQPLFQPDSYFGWQRSRAGAEAAAASADWSAEQAAFAAFRAYLEVQQAGSALAWAVSSQQEAAEIFRLGSERQQAGVGLRADVLQAQVLQAQAARRLLSVQNDQRIARRALALAMGRDGEVEIAAPVQAAELQGGGEAPTRRPDLAALAAREREAALAHRQSQAAWLPRLGVSASYVLHDAETPFGTEADSWLVAAGFSWELFSGFATHYGSRRTAASAEAAAQHRLEAWRQARFQLQEMQDRAAEAQSHLASAQQAVGQAAEGHRLMLQRFEAGLVNLSELLSAQAALDRARFDATVAESRYFLALGAILFQRGEFRQQLLPMAEGSKP
ncbi:MAG: TolC family protein [Desulfuromonadales bacterium]|nr:TolC family protein [Desulfuromonadales bacterium]